MSNKREGEGGSVESSQPCKKPKTGSFRSLFFKQPSKPVEDQNDKGPNEKGPIEKDDMFPLAVPLDVEVPQVQALEKAGAGYSTNMFTGEVRKVHQGLNATKGRGVINNKRVHTDQMSEGELEAAFADADNVVENDLKDFQEMMDNEAPCTIDKKDDEDVNFKPIYSNEHFSTNLVNVCRRQRKKKKVDASFYIRRERNPYVFDVTEKDKKVTETDDWNIVNKKCACILTFNADGTFYWPKSSPFKCWNCCEYFDGPPAMIPRHYNHKYQYYEIYGNFCGWSCAKRFESDSQQEFYSETAPSLDFFAYKYFGVKSVSMAPSRFLLDTFSAFGMPLDVYRNVGKVDYKDGVVRDNYVVMHPPVVPYEVMILWDERKPQRKAIKKGFDETIKRRFEEQMLGAAPLPNMPNPIVKKTTLVSDPITRDTKTKTTISTKKSKRNLFTMLSGQK